MTNLPIYSTDFSLHRRNQQDNHQMETQYSSAEARRLQKVYIASINIFY